ncbi:MerR family transcriptional regulator [Sanguibacter antarcticus]|uniref:DNA-binding transcriptional MerR regulator n=1 Tax=Sanguibacter antarcticus TaxID=372484 RepID=A0A2A9E9R7_9MICO|nr:MerR family transcriptional regulator [Sanguibacter antarcticus]PFG34959.1 DNA-binding transcriptional MerR regulator [Sanguibacter antarcticus]
MSQSHLHIGAVAEATGLSLRTLRHYDEIGLVSPSMRSEGGFRLYSEADLSRLLLVRRMKPLGFALEEMDDLLAVIDGLAATASPSPELHARLDAYVTSAHERRAGLARTLEMADEFITQLHARQQVPSVS